MSINLRQHCLAGGSHSVMLSAAGALSADQLAVRTRERAAALAAHPAARWGLWFTDSAEFLCSFLALALVGKAIVLPHNMQAGSARHISAHCDALLTDQPQPLSCQVLTPAELASGEEDFSPDYNHPVALTLFTSGSTGEPQAIGKSLQALERELEVLHACFGAEMGQRPVLSTVSHQHIYGLLHKLLWPLWRGAPVVTDACQYPEEIAALAAEHAPAVLISSPTHLTRLPAVPVFSAGLQSLQYIISSGGLLPTEAALDLHRLTGVSVTEVLGSTETGGVAWRQQVHSSLWQLLPGVEAEREEETGCLAVWSAHLELPAPFVMGDRVEMLDRQHFRLLGRADQIAKVEGKRLSLTEMQRRLEEHPLVREARLAVIRTRRDQVGAVVVLRSAGREQLRAGKRALNEHLREHLQQYFERPLLPRRWRYQPTLPRNSQGKVLTADISAMLLAAESEEPQAGQG